MTKDLLVQLIPGVFVIPGINNIGIITSENLKTSQLEVYIIDAGNNDRYGERILNQLELHFNPLEQNFVIKTLINTHAHSDHCGGDNFIKDKTGCKVWMPYAEKQLSEFSQGQGAIIWGGNAPEAIQKHFFMEKPVVVDYSYKETDSILLPDSAKISFISISGHSFNDFGVIYTNSQGTKILFAGDAVFSPVSPEKHLIHYMVQPYKFLDSLEKIKAVENLKFCVPGHGKTLQENIYESLELCKQIVLKTKQDILLAIKENHSSTEQIIKFVTDKNKISMNLTLFSLIRCTINSFLSDLSNDDTICPEVVNNELFWKIYE